MHRFARLYPLVALLVMSSVAPQAASVQSPRQCSAQGRVWYQDGPCATPQPQDRTLRKCVSPKGAVSIQNDPCPAGTRTAWARSTAPEQLSEARRRSLQQEGRKRDADSRYLSRLAGTDRLDRQYSSPRASRPSTRHAACDAAKRHREAVLKQVGLRRAIDLLRALNDRVYDACQ